ncbi:MAG: hypothetical protein P8K80_09715 [Phycisphaerales bacterium]|nr:hypothetical protein [Phycisphaerales bacterium]
MTEYDATGDLFDNGYSNLDISKVEISHDDANVNMKIELHGEITVANWGKYLVAIDAYEGGAADNPWGRNIDYSGVEADRFIGSWVDGGGGILGYKHYGGWNEDNSGLSMSVDSNSVTITFSRDWLGADISKFDFDVMTTGDGNAPGVDHLSRSDVATPGWGDTSYSGDFLTYNLPAPGALLLLGVAGLARSRRRR